jgi:hypothetical protein
MTAGKCPGKGPFNALLPAKAHQLCEFEENQAPLFVLFSACRQALRQLTKVEVAGACCVVATAPAAKLHLNCVRAAANPAAAEDSRRLR